MTRQRSYIDWWFVPLAAPQERDALLAAGWSLLTSSARGWTLIR